LPGLFRGEEHRDERVGPVELLHDRVSCHVCQTSMALFLKKMSGLREKMLLVKDACVCLENIFIIWHHFENYVTCQGRLRGVRVNILAATHYTARFPQIFTAQRKGRNGRCRPRRQNFKGFNDFCWKIVICQAQNLAVSTVCVPNLLDRGMHLRPTVLAPETRTLIDRL